MNKESIIKNLKFPEGWKMKALREVCDIQNGFGYKSKSYINSGYRVIRIGNVQNGQIVDKSPRYISERLAKQKEQFIIKEGDILTSLTGDVGRVGVFPIKMLPAVLNQRVGRFFNIQSSLIETKYLLQFLNSKKFEDAVIEGASGAAQKNTSTKKILELTIPLPPLPQQKQIVATLDKAFAAIDTAKANAEQNLKNAKELFESYLQNVFENKRDDWEEYELKEIVDEKCSLSYGIVQPGNPFPNGLPVIRPTNMKNKFVSPLGLKLIDPAKAKSYNRTTLVGDELLLCVRGETGVISITTVELKGANVTRGIVPVCFDSEKLSLPFGYYLFVSPLVQKQIKDKTYGAALMQINIRDVRELQMLIPSKKEQEIIVQKLDTLSQEVRKLKAIYTQKIADLEEMKKSLLQKAFSGQLNTVT